MASFDWKNPTRLFFLKIVGALLAVVFFAIAILFLSYSVTSVATTQGGKDAKILASSDHFGKLRTGCRLGGLFEITADVDGQKSEKIFCLYPVWPDQLQPSKGDDVRVWPSKKPLLAEPATDGWGWFIVGSILVVGLVLLEFSFLALTLR